MKGLVILAVLGCAHANLNASAGSNCGYVASRAKHVDVDDAIPSGAVYVGKAPLPEKIQGVFWLVDDGGDALVSFGGPESGGTGECNNGKLTQEGNGRYCATVSTFLPGGWTFQAVDSGKAGGEFPTAADTLYARCGMNWKFCFNSDQDATKAIAKPEATRRGWGCHVMALSKTTAVYIGITNGGQHWRVTTEVGRKPLPKGSPGNFDMIQVVDGHGHKVQKNWENFAAQNKQIVYYTGVPEASTDIEIV